MSRRNVDLGLKSFLKLFAVFHLETGSHAVDGATQAVAHLKHHQLGVIAGPARLDTDLFQLGRRQIKTFEGLFGIPPTHGERSLADHGKQQNQALHSKGKISFNVGPLWVGRGPRVSKGKP